MPRFDLRGALSLAGSRSHFLSMAHGCVAEFVGPTFAPDDSLRHSRAPAHFNDIDLAGIAKIARLGALIHDYRLVAYTGRMGSRHPQVQNTPCARPHSSSRRAITESANRTLE